MITINQIRKILQNPWFEVSYLVLIAADLIGNVKVFNTIIGTQLPTILHFWQFILIAITVINGSLVFEPATPEHFGKHTKWFAQYQPILIMTFIGLNIILIFMTGINFRK